MPKLPLLLSFVLLPLCSQAAAQSPTPSTDPAMCDVVATMPSAPMTVEACRSMLGIAKDDPAAHRPGDESMSCAAIFAELEIATADLGISDEEAARRQKTVRDAQTLNARHGAKAAAALAPNVATNRALATIAPFVPSAAIAPAVAANQADIQAKGKIAGAAYSAEARKLTGESTNTAASTMRDPRTRRLGQLAAQKNCQGPTR